MSCNADARRSAALKYHREEKITVTMFVAMYWPRKRCPYICTENTGEDAGDRHDPSNSKYKETILKIKMHLARSLQDSQEEVKI